MGIAEMFAKKLHNAALYIIGVFFLRGGGGKGIRKMLLLILQNHEFSRFCRQSLSFSSEILNCQYAAVKILNFLEFSVKILHFQDFARKISSLSG